MGNVPQSGGRSTRGSAPLRLSARGRRGEENMSVIVAPIEPGFSLASLGSPQQVAEEFLSMVRGCALRSAPCCWLLAAGHGASSVPSRGSVHRQAAVGGSGGTHSRVPLCVRAHPQLIPAGNAAGLTATLVGFSSRQEERQLYYYSVRGCTAALRKQQEPTAAWCGPHSSGRGEGCVPADGVRRARAPLPAAQPVRHHSEVRSERWQAGDPTALHAPVTLARHLTRPGCRSNLLFTFNAQTPEAVWARDAADVRRSADSFRLLL